MKRNLSGFIVAIGAVAILVAVVSWWVSRDDSLDHARSSNLIHIGYAVEAPYAFPSSGGQITGESAELAKLVVARLGIRNIAWRQTEFDSLIPELENGRIDVIAAGMFITRDRARRVAFSEPTFHVQPGLLVPKGNPKKLTSYRQAASLSDSRIAVLSGAVEAKELERLGMPESRLLFVPDALVGRVAVESRLADGLALSSPTVRWMALRDQLGKTEMVETPDDPGTNGEEHLGFGAFAFRKSDAQLLTAWNAVLKNLIGSPEHLALIQEFGLTSKELPGNTTTREILSQ